MKKCVKFVLICTIIFAKLHAKEKDSSDYVQYVDEIIASFSKEMYRDYGLECVGDGGRMPYDVEEISLRFVANRSATVEDARELEVKTTEKLIQSINAHEKIRPSLREYPFPASRAHVSVSFRDPKKPNTRGADNDVALVFQAKGRLFYQTYTPENPRVAKDIKDEPYEEALRIVQNNLVKNSLSMHKDVAVQATGSVASQGENAKTVVAPEKGFDAAPKAIEIKPVAGQTANVDDDDSLDELSLRDLQDILSEARKEHGFYDGK